MYWLLGGLGVFSFEVMKSKTYKQSAAFYRNVSLVSHNRNTIQADEYLKATVKKWFRDKEYGVIENGSGPEIIVLKSDLIKCQYLKSGAEVEFECYPDNQKLIAKKVTLVRQRHHDQQYPKRGNAKDPFIGVMK